MKMITISVSWKKIPKNEWVTKKPNLKCKQSTYFVCECECESSRCCSTKIKMIESQQSTAIKRWNFSRFYFLCCHCICSREISCSICNGGSICRINNIIKRYTMGYTRRMYKNVRFTICLINVLEGTCMYVCAFQSNICHANCYFSHVKHCAHKCHSSINNLFLIVFMLFFIWCFYNATLLLFCQALVNGMYTPLHLMVCVCVYLWKLFEKQWAENKCVPINQKQASSLFSNIQLDIIRIWRRYGRQADRKASTHK